LSEALSVLALGLKFPDSEEEALALALKAAANETDGIIKQMLGFYLGSAYEYGVGTKPDGAAAMKWYAVAAAGGDAISRRELTRLQAAKP
jgi:TPR repeat protein